MRAQGGYSWQREQHEQQHRGQEQLVVGNAKHTTHPFLFLVLHCGMEGFIQRKAIPNIKRPIEKVFWDTHGEVSPFLGACKITAGSCL